MSFGSFAQDFSETQQPSSLVFWVLAQDFSENMPFGISFRSGELFRGANMFFWVFVQDFSETPLALAYV